MLVILSRHRWENDRDYYVGIDEPILVRKFGRSDQRNERMGRLIEDLIISERTFYYENVEAMRKALVDREAAGRYLHIPPVYLHDIHNIHREGRSFPDGVNIIMTGSRNGDETAANIIAGFEQTPEEYTWHHCEHIRPGGLEDMWECTMKLVKKDWHRAWHFGGFNEYELMRRRF